MYFVDMHCDTLGRTPSGAPLISRYNLSKKCPQLQFFAHFSSAGGVSAEARRAGAMAGLYRYKMEISKNQLLPIESADDVRRAVRYRESAALFSIEGGGGLMPDSPEISLLYQGGLRVFGPVWDENELCAAAYSSDDYGITERGRALLSRILEHKIILDVSHMSDRGFWQLAEMTDAPLLATHSNFREVCRSPRNLTREMALEIKRRGGVIGLNLYPPLLAASGSADSLDIIRHIDYALELLGEDTAAFGFDIDGTGGKYPRGYGEGESIHDKVFLLLSEQYGEDIAEKIGGQNALRFLEEHL